MASGPSVAQVIVEVEPDHLDRPFDYAIPDDLADGVAVGSRVEVAFSGRRTRGLVAGLTDASEVDQLRPLRRLLGPHRWVDEAEIDLFRWAARRFAAPVAAVVRHALPGRVVDVERRAEEAGWFPPGAAAPPAAPPWAAPEETAWEAYGADGAWLRAAAHRGHGAAYWRPLPDEDLGARLVDIVGLTLAGGRDALVVVPEPVSAAADALAATFDGVVVDLRGEAGPRRVYGAWLRARCGRARLLIGERRVAFWPLPALGLAAVIDEANPSLKERRSPRHHVREVALERARRSGGVGLLIGHVPSAVGWRLLAERRLRALTPVRARERRAAPPVRIDDRRDPRSRGRLGTPAVDVLRRALERGELGVVLAARRGEGRIPACSRCGEVATCPRCASSLAVVRAEHGVTPVLCEGCGWEPAGGHRCTVCGATRFGPLAAGVRRMGEELRRMFPEARVAVLEGYAAPMPEPPALVVMTRGSARLDPPGAVAAVVLPDLDGQLRRPVLDAAEDALRLALRVGAWSRDVVVQTREPDHHAVQALVRWDPGGFWRAEVARRAELRFPPVAHAIRLDVDALDADRVAGELRATLPEGDEVLGPRSLERPGRSGILLKVDDRTATLAALAPLREGWGRDGVDVRVDVDPVDVL